MVAILDNLRSIENVGSIFRTADGLGIEKLYLCGTTPHPHPDEPWRRDHKALAKTALGAQQSVDWEYRPDTGALVAQLKKDGMRMIALETTPDALTLPQLHLKSVNEGVLNIALVVGNEVTGIASDVLVLADQIVQIPMAGRKESLNVAVAFGIAAFWLVTAPGEHRP